jgi:hypothetical protein
MSEISKLIFKNDGLYAERWIPPILKEKPQSEDDGDKLIEMGEDFFDNLEEEIERDTIKKGYYEIIPLILKHEADIFSHLRRQCEIDSGTTLRSIMNFVRGNKILTAFVGSYCWANAIDEYHNLLDKESKISENVKELEISWVTDEIVEYENPKRKKLEIERPNFSLSHDFHGLGPAGEEAKNWNGKEDELIKWSVSGTIDDVLDVPIKLSSEPLTYRKMHFPTEGGIKQTTILEGEAGFTLLEILDAIYWDITFYGSPHDSEEFHKDLMDRKDIAMDILNKEKSEEKRD